MTVSKCAFTLLTLAEESEKEEEKKKNRTTKKQVDNKTDDIIQ